MNHGFIANLAITPTATVAIDYCAEKIRETLGAN
jgi:hypothetical protein